MLPTKLFFIATSFNLQQKTQRNVRNRILGCLFLHMKKLISNLWIRLIMIG